MKKLTTLFAALTLGAVAVSAAPVDPGIRTDLHVTGIKPEFQQHFNVSNPSKIMGEVLHTREFIDRGGNRWEITFQMDEEKIADMLGFADENGNEMKISFDDLPFYHVVYTITRTKKNALTPDAMVYMHLEWPSMYIYNQVFEWDGETEIGANGKEQIPVDLRDYEPVSFEMLMNGANRCRKFQEDEAVGCAGNGANGMWEYYGMLPNSLLGIPCYYDGNYYTTMLNESTASYIEMQLLDTEEMYMEVGSQLYIDVNGNRRTLYCEYKGTGEIQGVKPLLQELPEWGDLHLFNTGLVSSELLGDSNPYPGDFGEMTQFFFIIGDKNMSFNFGENATTLVRDNIIPIIDDTQFPEGTNLMEYTNYIDGYAYADPMYAKDTTLNPENMSFEMGDFVVIGEGEDQYVFFTPALNGLVPAGLSDINGQPEPWSSQYGTVFMYHSLAERIVVPSSIGWGYNEGFVLNVQNPYIKTFRTMSTGKLIYHYMPNNINETRELSLVGNKGSFEDKVETIAVETAMISAANGVITVIPAENGAVAVYGLDGVCLKNVKANAGEAVNVEAAKGVYVVTVNGASRKVAL